MAQTLRIEDPERTGLITCRTQNSRLWFCNNAALEEKLLGYVGRLQHKYEFDLYGLVIQGNHYHMESRFPGANRAHVMRDLNSNWQRFVKAHVADFEGGSLWQRRYAEQCLPSNEDIEDYFFYCALQPINSGLCKRIEDYPGYNSFYDAIYGREREVTWVDWTKYHDAKRKGRKVSVEDYTITYKLKYKRLPGYETLSQEDYAALMLQKFNKRRDEIIKAKEAEGFVYPNPSYLRKTMAGQKPRQTKTSTRESVYPLVLTCCLSTKRAYEETYFALLHDYRCASKRFLDGEHNAVFPPGTYKPPLCFNPAV